MLEPLNIDIPACSRAYPPSTASLVLFFSETFRSELHELDGSLHHARFRTTEKPS